MLILEKKIIIWRTNVIITSFPDIIGICQTKPKKNANGVGIYVKSKITYRIRQDFYSARLDYEYTWLE